MAVILFANNATTTLAGAISNVAVTANLASGSGALFPHPVGGQYFALTFNDAATGLFDEIVYVTNVTGDTITMLRGQEGTAARSWLAGDLASNFLTAGVMAALVQAAASVSYLNMNVYQRVSGVQQVSVNGTAFTVTGATAFPAPVSGRAKVRAYGATGGGGGSSGANSAGSAGGGGGYAEGIFTGLVTSTAILVGLGGSGGSSVPTDGTNGGNSTFGSLMTAGGGGAGKAGGGSIQLIGGAPGTASGGTLNLFGTAGGTANALATAIIAAVGGSGYGAPSSPLLIGSTSNPGNNGVFPAGGAGGGINGGAGGAGVDGLVIVEY